MKIKQAGRSGAKGFRSRTGGGAKLRNPGGAVFVAFFCRIAQSGGKEKCLRIQSSVTGMESERSYYAVRSSAGSLRRSGRGAYANSFFAKYGEKYDEPEEEKETGEETGPASVTEIMEGMKTGIWRIDKGTAYAGNDTDLRVRRISLAHIFSILFREFVKSHHDLFTNEGGAYTQAPNADYGEGIIRKEYFGEREETSYKARGKAVCGDGREIDFDIHVGMSREFESLAVKKLGFDPGRAIDPLVINLDTDVCTLSDQFFYFDLDGDGVSERIRSLSGKSGYIALDKNGDGRIGDGTELFGASSGNGFEELSAYDEDGDGWIDEDDGIFEKLKVWIREKDGSEKLISFKEAGVGAVNLMNSPTEFSLKNKAGRTDAVIRATGMFLYEDGRTGTLQQVDAVV